MKRKLIRALQTAWVSVRTLLKWLVLGLITGAICGLGGAAFSVALNAVTGFRLSHGWIMLFLPMAGLVIVWLYNTAGLPNDSGTNQIIAAVRGEDHPLFRLAPLIFSATLLTHLCGGSAGREGAALQIGGGIASGLARIFHLDKDDAETITQCGMAGLFTALFGTPLAAACFSLEVVSVGIFQYSSLFPCLVTALTALGITQLLGIEAEAFPAPEYVPELNAITIVQVGVLAALAALLSMAFCVLMHSVSHLYKKHIPNQYIRVLVGGLLVILLTSIDGTGQYNGSSAHTLMIALEGQAVPWAFLLKMLFTAVTLGAGFRGGEIVPTFFVGATFGAVVGPLLGMDPAFAAAIGMIATFCGVVNCPTASTFMALELFGHQHIIFFGFACAVSYLLSGKFSLYSQQIIAYSKLVPEYIDEHAH